MRFIWLEKKPRVKLKIMIDEQKRVPHLELYHDAAALMWVKECLTLQNKKMLNLEGFNLRYGWYGYLCYEKKEA